QKFPKRTRARIAPSRSKTEDPTNGSTAHRHSATFFNRLKCIAMTAYYVRFPTCLSGAVIAALLFAFSTARGLASDYSPAVNDHLERGNSLMDRGKLGAARQEFDEAIKIEPKCPEALNNIGLCYLRDGLPDKATEYYDKA